MFTKKFFMTVLIAALVVATLTLTPFVEAQQNKPPAAGLRPDAPDYAKHGPYWVGVRDVLIKVKPNRPLNASIWYPALNLKGLKEVITYSVALAKVDLVALGLPANTHVDISGHALLDAAPDLSAAPYPLVIYSHGFGGYRQAYAYVAEHLASQGFVVIVPDHLEMWDPMYSDIADSTVERPMDIQQVIAYAEALTSPGGDMPRLFNIEQIAVAGHSQGGYAALTAAGGLFDTAAFNARCRETPSDTSFATTFCKTILPHEAELAALAGYDSVPQGLWPSWGDRRVKAVVSLAGSPILQKEGLSKVTVPLLAMVGTLDTAGEGLLGTRQIFESVGSSQKALVTFENAEHLIFNWQCKEVPTLVEIGFFAACSDAIWDMDRAHDLINHFTTAFLLDVLKGDKDAHKALLQNAVKLPGIDYRTTMK